MADSIIRDTNANHCDPADRRRHCRPRRLLPDYTTVAQQDPAATLSMANLWGLPPELRALIYSFTFGRETAILDAGKQDIQDPQSLTLLPKSATIRSSGRTGQLLWTCKAIAQEATPILYSQTLFIFRTSAWAGRLPPRFAPENSLINFSMLRHFTLELDCQFFMRFYEEDMQIGAEQLAQLHSLTIKCHFTSVSWVMMRDEQRRAEVARSHAQIQGYINLLNDRICSLGNEVRHVLDRSEPDLGALELELSKPRTARPS